MAITRAQQRASSGNPGSSPVPAEKVTKGTSKVSVKPRKAAGKKAAPGKKAAVAKKAATGKKSTTKAATISEDPAEDVFDGAEFPSPTNSVGPPIAAHPPRNQAVLALARQGPSYRATTTTPIGLYNPNALCYANVSIAMLMNLTPFVGFLEQHGSAPRYYNDDNRLEQDILARLNDIAMEYWSADGRGKQTRVEALAKNFKQWLIDVANRGLYNGTNPWAPTVGSHEDASESLDKILEIALMQLSTFDANEANTLEALTQPVFQQRWACRGIGKTCPNIERVRVALVQNDPFQRLLMLELPPFAPGAKTLLDSIRHFMNERTNMRTCGHCLDLYQPSNPKGRNDGMGREWHRIREAPECLIIKLNRSKMKGTKPYKSTENVSIPEMVDLTEYLEADDKDTGVTARYRLDVLVSHAGLGVKVGHYICHVRNHADPTRWHCLNDQVTTNERFAEAVGDQRSRTQLFTPYLLGFTRIHPSADDKQSADGRTARGLHDVTSGNDGPQRSDSKNGGSKRNGTSDGDSKRNGLKDDESSRGTPKSPTVDSSRTDQVHQGKLATFTASLFPIGGGDRPFHTVTQQIRLDFDVGKRSTIPIEVTLDLPHGRQLHLERLERDRRQYVLAPKNETKPVRKDGSDSAVRYPRLPSPSDHEESDKKPEPKAIKRKRSGSPKDQDHLPRKSQRLKDDRQQRLDELTRRIMQRSGLKK